MNLSIVIPTKNRSLFLSKLLNYHAQMKFEGSILIGDASFGEELFKNQQLVKEYEGRLHLEYFHHAPETSLIEGTNLLLEAAKTPFSVLAGDDDFLVPQALARCVEFLEGNADFSCACGQQAYTYVEPAPDGSFQIKNLHAGYSKTHIEALASQRILAYCFPNKKVNTFSVQRTKEMALRWREASNLGLDKTKFHVHVHEVAVNVMSLIEGKQICFKDLYHVMLRHLYKEGGERGSYLGGFTWLGQMCSWDWSEEIRNLVSWWTLRLSQKDGIDKKMAKDISEAVFMQCFIPIMITWRDKQLKDHHLPLPYEKISKEFIFRKVQKISWLRRFWVFMRGTNKITLRKFLNGKSMYYKDFQPIHQVLSEAAPKNHTLQE